LVSIALLWPRSGAAEHPEAPYAGRPSSLAATAMEIGSSARRSAPRAGDGTAPAGAPGGDGVAGWRHRALELGEGGLRVRGTGHECRDPLKRRKLLPNQVIGLSSACPEQRHRAPSITGTSAVITGAPRVPLRLGRGSQARQTGRAADEPNPALHGTVQTTLFALAPAVPRRPSRSCKSNPYPSQPTSGASRLRPGPPSIELAIPPALARREPDLVRSKA
jgi:hypothetical protein